MRELKIMFPIDQQCISKRNLLRNIIRSLELNYTHCFIRYGINELTLLMKECIYFKTIIFALRFTYKKTIINKLKNGIHFSTIPVFRFFEEHRTESIKYKASHLMLFWISLFQNYLKQENERVLIRIFKRK